MYDIQLFCFTHAGGSASFFNQIEKELTGIEVIKFEYSGHGARFKEPFYSDFEQLSEDLYNQMKQFYHGGKYAMFGYSMGSISMVEVLKRIENELIFPLPERVFLAAHEPHTKAELLGFSEEEFDDWVKRRTILFGAVPEKLISNKSFWRIYLPLYKSDYSIIGKYNFERLELKSSVPATIFYSEKDTPYSEMKKWEMVFVKHCEFFEFEGTHFFIQRHYAEIAKIINARL